MRWSRQRVDAVDASALPGMEAQSGFVRSVTAEEFPGTTFHEVLAKSALNHVPRASAMPFDWTINPYRGCTHACTYCFARGTHEHLELDAGRAFDSQIVVKTNVVEVLRRELSRPSWSREPVALGTNTDPYQRAEGRYGLMPGVIEALADSGTPFSILTKGTLLRRDLPLLVEARRSVDVSLALSIAVFDSSLARSLEPGAPSASARLNTVAAAAQAGFRVSVFLMPVIPYVTDAEDALDSALSRIKAAGAARVVFGALHLRPGAKQWFSAWLARERPDLVEVYAGLYPGRTVSAPASYRRMLADRVGPLLRRHRLGGGVEEEVEVRRPEPATVRVTRPVAVAATLFRKLAIRKVSD